MRSRVSATVYVPLAAVILMLVATAAYLWSTETVRVPDLRGLAVVDARHTIETDGLKLGETTRPDGTKANRFELVESQSPHAGTRARLGTPVDLGVVEPTARYAPSLVGLFADDARAILKEKGIAADLLDTGGTIPVPVPYRDPTEYQGQLGRLKAVDLNWSIVTTQLPAPGDLVLPGRPLQARAVAPHNPSAHSDADMHEVMGVHGVFYLRYGLRGTRHCLVCHGPSAGCSEAPSCHSGPAYSFPGVEQ